MSDMIANEPEERRMPPTPATIGLLVANAVVFLFQISFAQHYPRFPFDGYFALSLAGLRHGFIWQLITFQFMHGGIWHIVFNCWAIFVFGRVVEISLGWQKMLRLYLLSGVIGGLVQIIGTLLFPNYFGDAGVVGASAGAFGLVASFAALYPREQLYMLLVIIPLKLKARTLMLLALAIAIFGILFPLFADRLPMGLAVNIYGFLGGNVAHAAHLGGIITGYFYTHFFLRNYHARRAAQAANANPQSSLKIKPAHD